VWMRTTPNKNSASIRTDERGETRKTMRFGCYKEQHSLVIRSPGKATPPLERAQWHRYSKGERLLPVLYKGSWIDLVAGLLQQDQLVLSGLQAGSPIGGSCSSVKNDAFCRSPFPSFKLKDSACVLLLIYHPSEASWIQLLPRPSGLCMTRGVLWM
jgi:hypothetical protein